jgi:hypothetical protein
MKQKPTEKEIERTPKKGKIKGNASNADDILHRLHKQFLK